MTKKNSLDSPEAKRNRKKIEDQIHQIHRRVRNFTIGLILLLIIIFSVLMIIAVKQNPCAKVEGQVEKDNCYYELAELKMLRGYCHKISDNKLSESCLSLIAVNNNDLAICRDLKNSSRGFCIKKIAEKKEDPSVCIEITDQYWSDLCYFELSIILEEASLCNAVLSEKTRNKCFFDFSLRENNTIGCDNIKNKDVKDVCYLNIAVITSNLSICDKTLTLPTYGTCMEHFAILHNDSELCSNIKEDFMKNNCFSNFN